MILGRGLTMTGALDPAVRALARISAIQPFTRPAADAGDRRPGQRLRQRHAGAGADAAAAARPLRPGGLSGLEGTDAGQLRHPRRRHADQHRHLHQSAHPVDRRRPRHAADGHLQLQLDRVALVRGGPPSSGWSPRVCCPTTPSAARAIRAASTPASPSAPTGRRGWPDARSPSCRGRWGGSSPRRGSVRPSVALPPEPATTLAAGDVVLLHDSAQGLRDLAAAFQIHLFDRARAGRFVEPESAGEDSLLAEVVIGRRRRWSAARCARHASPRAISVVVVGCRQGAEGLLHPGRALADLPLAVGDVLLARARRRASPSCGASRACCCSTAAPPCRARPRRRGRSPSWRRWSWRRRRAPCRSTSRRSWAWWRRC